MASGWKTRTVVMEGGTRLDLEPVLRDASVPGSLIDSQNFESGQAGGYARVKGYDFYDESEVPGADRVLGCFVHNNGVLACRGTGIYFSLGSGWGSDIAPSSRTNAGQYRAARYSWAAGNYITLVDGVNDPVRFNGSTGTDLTSAPAGATCVIEFQNHLFFGKGGVVTFSAPDDDTDYNPTNGAGEFAIGDTVQNFGIWRSKLYIFCENSIHALSGSNAETFALVPVTGNIGCIYPDTVVEVAGDILFLAPDGIRTISATDLSGEVNLSTVSNPIKQTILDNMELFENGRICAVTVERKSQYRLFFSDETTTAAESPGINACLVNNNGAFGFEFFNLKGIQVSTADHGQINDGADELVIHGCWNGYVFKQETGNNFAGSDIDAYIQLAYLVFDDPAVRKILHRLRLYVKTEGDAISRLTAQVLLDDSDGGILQPAPIDLTTNIPLGVAVYGYSTSTYGTALYGRGASSNYRTGTHGAGFNISLKISSNDSRPSYAIKTAIMEYSLGARQ